MPAEDPHRGRVSAQRRFRALAAVLCALVCWGAGTIPPAGADTFDDYASARRELDRLRAESDGLVDEYNGVADELDRLTAEIADSEDRVADLEEYVEGNRAALREQAVAAYKYGGAPMVRLGRLLETEDLDAYRRGMKYLDLVQGRAFDAYRTFVDDEVALDSALDKLASEQAERRAMLAELEKRRKEIDASIEAQEAIVDRFRAQLEKEAADDALAARQLIEAGGLPPATTEQARGAIEFAKSQLGRPYCWGGTGPSCFDCSGIIQKAYASVGVRLPRTSHEMNRLLPRSLSPQPGDIAWHPGHVGLYVGAGFTIEAPHTGDIVRYRPVGDRYQVFLTPVSLGMPPSTGDD